MTERRDPFEERLAGQLSEFSDVPLERASPAEQVATKAMNNRPKRWRIAIAGAAAAAAILLTAVVLRGPWQWMPSASGIASPIGSAQPRPFDARTLLYQCGYGFSFSPSVLDQPETDLNATPSGRVLADFAARHAHLPDRGWHLVGSDDSSALFLADLTGSDVTGNYYPEARVERKENGWRVVGFGGCQPKVAVDDLHAATFRLAHQEDVGPETTTFEVRVEEWACVSGQSSQDRLQPPLIAYQSDRIVIAFTIAPVRVPVDGIEPGLCVGNPESSYRVQLAEPIGTRAVVDAGRLPWAVVGKGGAAHAETPTEPSLEPADEQEPTAGACVGPLSGAVVTVELRIDTPAPRCVKARPTQQLRVVNLREETVTVRLAGTIFAIPRGDSEIVSPDLGQVWEPGVHVVSAREGGPRQRFEVWLVATE